MASTTIPAVKAGLLTVLEGISVLTDANVDIRYAEHAERRRDAVWMGSTTSSEIEPMGFRSGAPRRKETVEIALWVEARETKPLDAETTAFSYVTAIESALVADPDLGGVTGLRWCSVTAIEAATVDGGDGAYCQIELTIECTGVFL